MIHTSGPSTLDLTRKNHKLWSIICPKAGFIAEIHISVHIRSFRLENSRVSLVNKSSCKEIYKYIIILRLEKIFVVVALKIRHYGTPSKFVVAALFFVVAAFWASERKFVVVEPF